VYIILLLLLLTLLLFLRRIIRDFEFGGIVINIFVIEFCCILYSFLHVNTIFFRKYSQNYFYFWQIKYFHWKSRHPHRTEQNGMYFFSPSKMFFFTLKFAFELHVHFTTLNPILTLNDCLHEMFAWVPSFQKDQPRLKKHLSIRN
jgi:hypothetical protein